jgi:hypothetical protein
MTEAATMKSVTSVAHPRDSVVIGGYHLLHAIPLLCFISGETKIGRYLRRAVGKATEYEFVVAGRRETDETAF